ncbi:MULTISPECIES: helix-turn-helix domain-containing protein [Providencia]|uniref:DNA-binding helix-turn-helix protein n=3 Tax=Providencia alcalifaciens TaxID=126385 RepID=B6XH56_9GAMM|nr:MULTISPECIES: helix-turn-helix transcriptional regulator [Providencia]ATG15411.1 XRE family transcriptional regulator [Providencia alcalifaciens]EEB45249.1 DNA-binding helix-turn-helix protein [Providencia alcalifaciens DSM 30120]EKT63387.1 fimbrial operon regulator [Providencia alcalifaciens Dmel2]EUD05028.1 DNA-binding helix-turn-helix protein [Providencia alcalifaciens RIMD 1656011]EUD07468.1 DNA-binding helix-turn-helix protein [Providencia alcalifaciens R90-1475]
MKNSYPVSAVIGYKIRELRKEKGLSLLAVAKTIGISEQQQLRYERGHNRISIDRLKQYAIYFNININDFFLFNEHEKEKIKRELRRKLEIQ